MQRILAGILLFSFATSFFQQSKFIKQKLKDNLSAGFKAFKTLLLKRYQTT